MIKKLIVVLVLLFGSIIGLLSLTVDSQPSLVNREKGSLESAQQVKNLIRKVRNKVRPRPQNFSLGINSSEFHAIGGFAQRALPQLRVNTELQQRVAKVRVSFELPIAFERRYLNGQVTFGSSKNGVLISEIVLGKLVFDQNWSIALLIKLLDLPMDGLLSALFSQITEVQIAPQKIILYVSSNEPLMQQLNQLAAQFGLQGKNHEKQRIQHYFGFLQGLRYVLPERRNLSLMAYLKPLINEAGRRSQLTTAADENRSALLALGYFAGHRHFAGVIGSYADIQRKPIKSHRLLLAGRHDLQQHFLYSVLFKLLSDQGVSTMLGELKELMDSGRGGSGFSFADLAADLGGTRFAEFATDEKSAPRLQAAFAGKITERWIFPTISDLEEGLTTTDFRTDYGEIDSPEYVKIINDIQSRIDDLTLYNYR